MHVICNGDPISTPAPCNLTELLEQLDITTASIAIAVNQTIIQRANWSAISLHDHDVVDIFQATLGG